MDKQKVDTIHPWIIFCGGGGGKLVSTERYIYVQKLELVCITQLELSSLKRSKRQWNN